MYLQLYNPEANICILTSSIYMPIGYVISTTAKRKYRLVCASCLVNRTCRHRMSLPMYSVVSSHMDRVCFAAPISRIVSIRVLFCQGLSLPVLSGALQQIYIYI